jgi:type I restriction enzyme S subunit
MNGLPQGWSLAPIEDLISASGLFSDGDWVESKDQDPSGNIRLLQLADIGDGKFIDKSARFLNQEQFDRLKCTELMEGDILIARMPAPLGRACVLPKMPQRCVTVVDVAIIRTGTNLINNNWLTYFINSPTFRGQIQSFASGTTRQRIARAKLGKINLPIAPSAEQFRIENKVSKILSNVGSCKARLNRVPKLLKQLRQAVLEAALSGKLTEEWRKERNIRVDEWKNVKVRDVVSRIEAGLNVRCDERPPNLDEKGLLKISSVTWGTFDESESKTFFAGTDIDERKRIKVGDFLISRANTIELVGACVIVHGISRQLYLSDKVLRLEMPSEIKPWLLYNLRSISGRNQIESMSSGNQLSMRNLSQENLLNIEIVLPPLVEIQEIVSRVETLLSIADRTEAKYLSAKKLMERVEPSLLNKAFQGDLIPQNLNDEPAEKLLERIRKLKNSEKFALTDHKKTRKKTVKV